MPTRAEMLSRASGLTMVVSASDVLNVTPTLDTSIYADGDLLSDTQAIADAFRIPGGSAMLQSVNVLDEDDQGVALDLIFLSANNKLGTINSAPTVSDASARDILGIVRVGAGDFIDLGGCRVATLSGLGLMMEAASASTTLYLATVTRGGTPTYTAAGLKLKLGLIWD